MSVAQKGNGRMSRLRITRRTRAHGVEALRLAGDVDAHTAPRLAAAIRMRIEAGVERIVLDLDGVRLIDSSGLYALAAARHHAAARGACVQVICRSVRLQRLFVITGLAQASDVFASEAARVRRLSQRGRRAPGGV